VVNLGFLCGLNVESEHLSAGFLFAFPDGQGVWDGARRGGEGDGQAWRGVRRIEGDGERGRGGGSGRGGGDTRLLRVRGKRRRPHDRMHAGARTQTHGRASTNACTCSLNVSVPRKGYQAQVSFGDGDTQPYICMHACIDPHSSTQTPSCPGPRGEAPTP
jgi:hypothetical protein